MPAADDRARWIALYVLCTGMLMIVLDATIVNVALPSIQNDLGFSRPGLAWVVNAYLIAFGGLLLLAGRLGDLVSRRDVFLVGLAVFSVASLACGVATSQAMLVAARFVQGVGGALTSSVILGMIVTMFPEPREQAKAIGVFGFVASAGGSIGLFLGGVLTQAINWHWIFVPNVPIGVATAVFALRRLERDRGIGLRQGADAPGAVLITSALMLAVYTIVKPAAEDGWGAGTTLGLGAVALGLVGAFVAREATAQNPLVPLRIFRSRNVTGANVVQMLMLAGFFGQGFLGALYFQRVLHYSALGTGAAFVPLTLVMGVMSVRYSEPVITRVGGKAALLGGLSLITVGLLWFARAPQDASYVADLLPTMLLLGLGAGVAGPAVVGLAMSGATPQDAGLASGLVNTTTQVGGALGLAVLSTLAATHTRTERADGSSLAAALTSGYQLAFLISGLLVAAAVGLGALVLRAAPAPALDPAAAPQPAGDEGLVAA